MQRYIISTAIRHGRHGRGITRLFASYGGGDSISYSGGQATVGQGGYYASGGARLISPSSIKHSTDFLALDADVEKVSSVMDELAELETKLSGESSDGVSGKNIELRNSIKKLMTSSAFLESLSRLEVNGEPVWGLNESEREMVVFAREKVNSS